LTEINYSKLTPPATEKYRGKQNKKQTLLTYLVSYFNLSIKEERWDFWC
jgi:hypothetical protein